MIMPAIIKGANLCLHHLGSVHTEHYHQRLYWCLEGYHRFMPVCTIHTERQLMLALTLENGFQTIPKCQC